MPSVSICLQKKPPRSLLNPLNWLYLDHICKQHYSDGMENHTGSCSHVLCTIKAIFVAMFQPVLWEGQKYDESMRKGENMMQSHATTNRINRTFASHFRPSNDWVESTIRQSENTKTRCETVRP